MDTRYELLSEDDVMQGGDVVIGDDGWEMIINPDGGWVGSPVIEMPGWLDDVVAILRPPTTH